MGRERYRRGLGTANREDLFVVGPVGAYDGALRSIVHALKYDGRRSVAGPLAALMRERGADVLTGADADLTKLPAHLQRSMPSSNRF